MYTYTQPGGWLPFQSAWGSSSSGATFFTEPSSVAGTEVFAQGALDVTDLPGDTEIKPA